ncbi:MAG: DUF1850 domain-containing protein [Candidatus Atribacteria bacterium]|nr:DUF1850 domain-containing protein [Candidatus Atribacteria bacterium]
MNKSYRILAIILGIFIILTLFFYLYKIQVISICNNSNNQLILLDKISPGKQFLFEYNHSVSKTTVWEFFEVNRDYQLILVETDFLDHGAGLPYTSFGDEIFVHEDGKFKIKNMNRKIYLPLYYRVGKSSKNHFHYENKDYNLSEIVGDSVVIIDIKPMNILQYFIEQFIKDWIQEANL